MIRSSKYIIKRIIIGIGIAIGVMCFKNYVSFAATVDTIYRDYSSSYIGTSYWYKAADVSTTIDMIGMGPELPEENIYYNFLFCTTADYGSGGTAWTNSSDPNSAPYNVVKFVSGNLTNIQCTISGTNTKGRIYQVTGNTRTGADGGGDIRMVFHFSFHDTSSTNLIKYGLSASSFDLIKSEKDYTSQLNSLSTTITNNWQTQINKLQDILGVTQQQMAEAQIQTGWQKRAAEAAEAFNRAVNDDGIDENDQDSKMNTIKNSGYNNASISDIILLPVKVFQTAVNGLSGNSCTPVNLGTLYDTELILPCISSSDMQNWLSVSVYGLIDALMSFGVILGIRKLVIKIYRTIVYLRDGGGTID